MTEDYDDLYDELIAWVERYLAQVVLSDDHQELLRQHLWGAPGEAAGWLLGSHVIGEWDLTEEEVARLWLIGHVMGYRSEDLLHDDTLAKAAPGRGVRPPTPPGFGPPLLGGGGHGPGRGLPGKREFPGSWSDGDVIAQTMDVARQPSGTSELPSGDFRAYGDRNGISLGVLVSPQGQVLTSYPLTGDGLVQNPLDDERAHHVAQLQALVDAAPDDARIDLDELMAVGEWPHVVTSLRALDLPWSDEQRQQLARLAELAGLPERA